MTRVLIFGDTVGVPQLLKHVPPGHVVGVVASRNRPQYHSSLLAIAKAGGLPLLIQPLPSHRDYGTFLADLQQLRPELILVNSYSMILRSEVLALPPLGALNLHGALLPRYRGSNPTQWAILNHETRTGVTLHQMSTEIDQGGIVAQSEVPLYFEDTWCDVHARLLAAADDLLAKHMTSLLAGTWRAMEQDESRAFVTRRRTPDDGRFTWGDPLVRIYNLIRALVAPLPGAFVEGASGRLVLDRYLSLSELLALKSRHTDIAYEGLSLRPTQPGEPDADVRAKLWLLIEGPDGRALRGCVGGFDWNMRTADVSVMADRPVNDELRDRAVNALVRFAARELQLSAAGSMEHVP